MSPSLLIKVYTNIGTRIIASIISQYWYILVIQVLHWLENNSKQVIIRADNKDSLIEECAKK